jgi:uncharacterized protein YkwD
LPRSVTKATMLTSIPLLGLALVSLLVTAPRHSAPFGARHLTSTAVALVHWRHDDMPPARSLVATTPTPGAPTPAVPTPAPRARTATVVTHPKPVPTAPRPVSSVGGAAGVEFSLINQDRARSGVAGLAWSGALARVAQYRAQDMLNRNYFSHYDPATGQLAFAQLLRLWGIPYSRAGENIAWSTNPSMAGINTMFMNSPEHRANILNTGYHRVGVGVAGNGTKTMVVEVFSN